MEEEAKPEYTHVPVMPVEILDYLDIQEGKVYIDGTLGGAGHSKMILDKLNGAGHLYSFDQDIYPIENLKKIFKLEGSDEEISSKWLHPITKNFTAVYDNFGNFEEFYNEQKSLNPDFKVDGGILLDLGLSSIQLDDPERGFSFNKEGPLDMRLDPEGDLTAYDVVNKVKEEDLANIIYKYGDERLSRRIARKIVASRPVQTTTELADIVTSCYPGKLKHSHKSKSGKSKSVHPATRTFMAIRIYVNKELDVLEKILASAQKYLEPGARVVVLSYQSLEDRITKWAFRDGSKNLVNNKKYKILTKKPLEPNMEEIKVNPRARSAKLRVAEIACEEGIN